MLNSILVQPVDDGLNSYALEKLEEIKAYDLDLYEHCISVANLAAALCRQMKMDEVDIANLWIAGALHDYGKMFIDKRILNKPGKLTDYEYEIMQKHVLMGVSVLGNDKRLPEICLIGIREHHERKRGDGYPFGISEISEYGEILAVCDVYSALRAERVYKTGIPREKALEILRHDKVFRKEIVDALEAVTSESVLDVYRGESRCC